MPKKAKFTREEITEAAFSLVREEGAKALTARSLAARLGTSTAPIFTVFDSTEALLTAVKERAGALYESYLYDGMKQPLPFKGAGLAYIRFAKDEPRLFRFLFIECDTPSPFATPHYLPGGDKNEEAVRKALESSHDYETERAKFIYNHLTVYVHGLASLYAYGNCTFTEEDIDRMLSEVFVALTAKSTSK